MKVLLWEDKKLGVFFSTEKLLLIKLNFLIRTWYVMSNILMQFYLQF